MDIAVSVKHLTKKYKLYQDKWGPIKEVVSKKKLHKEFLALNDVSLDFPKGEAIGVLGTNGSGKSTLLKIITGIADPTSGTVEVNGALVFLDVSSGIDSELSGYDNIFMKGVLLGYSKEEMMEKADDIIEFSELGDFINQPVKNYSSGMKAKLGFAISVNVNPDILIVDEALAVGDSMFRAKCMNKMNEFKEQGKTIIFVSHDKNAVESFCSKAAWINKGELIAYGDSKHVGSIYNEFMSGRKKLEEIRTELTLNHSIEQVYQHVTDEGLSLELKGYLYGTKADTSFDFVLKENRTGEYISKPLERIAYSGRSSLPADVAGDAGFAISISEREYPNFLKPGAFTFLVRSKNENGEWVQFPLWAGNADLEGAVDQKGQFLYKAKVENNQLILRVDNLEKVQEQVNKIWLEGNNLHIEGVAFVRGYEAGSQEDVSIRMHVVDLESFEEKSYPAVVSETEEITENPSFNPQGKNYNFAQFKTVINLDEFNKGKYEYRMKYKMNKEPFHEMYILVWASNSKEYPGGALQLGDKEVEIQTGSKYLRMEVR
ncbi:ABC-type polysaccharide/polyol phosphate transport system ATPase subunit [Peribacillus deserti]|uniref:ABC-type polysaccharide/polyol phosphate transport system ATPase subunit n=1 Tax=Peribacillus deserti TaxID=673318 RepID=A0ABS2QCI1_9BACI|nr:ABC transporter ATP-binding protein [Peribacillus deserti]MBM7690735.1 ABC-type polysaccharide/polyol phosphate transport system ATPase subunit [Peribacillus deserti]